MPRSRRIDAPGLFHHVVVRGVERRAVFVDDEDRYDFLRRLGRILHESEMPCLAWVLIPNHVHLLVRTVSVSISRVMARLGTGYARRFNERHGRVGHLFQNRFLSRPIEDDADLRGVVRYVHLNPIKHGLVGTLDELPHYPWCGHRALVGAGEPWPFHDVAAALACFDSRPARAREVMVQDLREGAATMEALGEDADRTSRPSPATSQGALAGDDLSPLIDDVARSLGVARRELTGGGRARRVVRARAALAYRAHVERRIPVAHLVAALGLTEATVRRAIDAQRARLASSGIAAPEGPSLSPTDRNAGTSPNERQ